jgi:hypothetical protein
VRSNDLAFVHETLRLLRGRGVAAWIFGGWAEELLRLRPPRPHNDVDLLVRAPIGGVRLEGLGEIRAKRFGHKRAFLLGGIMIELFLVETDISGLFTRFWTYRHDWPDDALADCSELPVVSRTAVIGYRRRHHLVDRARPSLAGRAGHSLSRV